MFDDLREQGAELEFLEEDMTKPVEPLEPDPNIILGMTPVQRLVIAIMLLLMVIMITAFALLVTGKVALPFLY